jgi:hypothetical protein
VSANSVAGMRSTVHGNRADVWSESLIGVQAGLAPSSAGVPVCVVCEVVLCGGCVCEVMVLCVGCVCEVTVLCGGCVSV